MSAIIAHGSVVGGDSPWMLIWFGMFLFGILFIALALRDDSHREKEDDSVTDLQDRRDLPLRHLIKSTRPEPSPASEKSLSRRGSHGPNGPRGLVH